MPVFWCCMSFVWGLCLCIWQKVVLFSCQAIVTIWSFQYLFCIMSCCESFFGCLGILVHPIPHKIKKKRSFGFTFEVAWNRKWHILIDCVSVCVIMDGLKDLIYYFRYMNSLWKTIGTRDWPHPWNRWQIFYHLRLHFDGYCYINFSMMPQPLRLWLKVAFWWLPLKGKAFPHVPKEKKKIRNMAPTYVCHLLWMRFRPFWML